MKVSPKLSIIPERLSNHSSIIIGYKILSLFIFCIIFVQQSYALEQNNTLLEITGIPDDLSLNTETTTISDTKTDSLITPHPLSITMNTKITPMVSKSYEDSIIEELMIILEMTHISPTILPEDRASFTHTSHRIFRYLSEIPLILQRLQEQHGIGVVSEYIYRNTCETNNGNNYYKFCPLTSEFKVFNDFLESAICENIFVRQTRFEDYEFSKNASRRETVSVAVKMRKNQGERVELISDLSTLHMTYADVADKKQKERSFSPILATALRYGIISPKRIFFEADKSINRAEAFAMIMKSVCMLPLQEYDNVEWQKNVHQVATENTITERSWSDFRSDEPILRSELLVIASRAMEWAERTGGCNPKPAYCFSEKEALEKQEIDE